ncbi:MAG: hypothetical protein OEZ25_08940 [Candidatus Bathyarchaeota archaeon]|nr:hypothetical protein [Candidatus Bathyarchaeota archaeon]
MQAKGETQLEYELRGKTWRVYWLLLKSGRPMGVREVQRTLHFSSPSVAEHHLERLRNLGLVKKQDISSRYFLVSKVKIGVLRHFIKLGRLMLPRYFFYAVFSTMLLLLYLTMFMQELTRGSLFFVLFGAIVSIIFWYEAFRVWSMRPF